MKSIVIKTILATSLLSNPLLASSHREAPGIAQDPAADISDLYAFQAPGNENDAVTLVMNVSPAQIAASGPNWYRFGDDVLYEFNIDRTGNGQADISYQFRFKTKLSGDLPLAYLSPGFAQMSFNGTRFSHGLTQNYTVTKVTRKGASVDKREIISGAGAPVAPARVGPRTTDFAATDSDTAYKKLIEPTLVTANGHRIFAGPRNDPFFIDLGAAFDTLNIRSPAVDTLAGINVLSIVLEVPVEEIFGSAGKKIMGVWATTKRQQSTIRRAGKGTPAVVGAGGWVQTARLGNPLVNELVIGLNDKDKFNATQPKDDAQFANFILNPALAVALNAVFGPAGLKPVRTTGRNDLALVFGRGVPGINEISSNGPVADMLRINLAAGTGFPNGRNLTDDIVDVALKVVADCSTKALGLPADLPGSKNYALTSLNCKLGDGVNADDTTKGGAGIATNSSSDFPYVGIPHSNFETSVNQAH